MTPRTLPFESTDATVRLEGEPHHTPYPLTSPHTMCPNLTRHHILYPHHSPYSPRKNYPRQILPKKTYYPNKIVVFSRLVGSEILIICSIAAPVSARSGHARFKELVFNLDEFPNMFVMAVSWIILEPFVLPFN